MAIKKKIETEAQKLAHCITFSGYDLATGGGSVSVHSHWVNPDGERVSTEESITKSIAELRVQNPMGLNDLDKALRKFCEFLWEGENHDSKNISE